MNVTLRLYFACCQLIQVTGQLVRVHYFVFDLYLARQVKARIFIGGRLAVPQEQLL